MNTFERISTMAVGAAGLAKKGRVLATATVTTLACAPAGPTPEPRPPEATAPRPTRPAIEPIQPIEAVIDQTFGHPGSVGTGAVLGVLYEGEPYILEAWGRPSATATDSLTVDALVPFPGMTEVLVAMVVRALDASGRLDAHAPVADLDPDLPVELGRTTLDQLLRHEAGLDDARIPEGSTLEEEIAKLPGHALYGTPGVAYSVSKYSIPLAARVLEAHFQLPIADIVDRAVITPLGLPRSTLDPGGATFRMEATVYTMPDSASRPEPVEPVTRLNGLPVFYTTVPEALTLLRAWLQGAIGGADPWEVLAASTTPPHTDFLVDGFSSNRYGTSRELATTRRVTGSGPEPTGVAATARVHPQTGTVVVSWSNADRGLVADFPRRISNLVQSALMGPTVRGSDRVVDEPDDAPTPDGAREPLTAWAGLYLNGDRKIVLREPETDLGGAELAWWSGERELPMEWIEDGLLIARLGTDDRVAARLVPFIGSDGRRYVHMRSKTFARQDDDDPGG